MQCNAHALISGAIVMLYTWSFLLAVSHYVIPLKGVKWLLAAASGVFNAAISIWLISYNIRISDSYLIAIAIIFIEILAIFRYDIHVLIFAALHLGVHLVTLRSLSICIISLTNPITLFGAMTSPIYRFYTFILTYTLLFIFLIGSVLLLKRQSLQIFFKHKSQMTMAYVSALVLCLYQFLCTKAFYYTVELQWFVILQLISAIFMLIAYYFIFVCSLQVSAWVTSTVENARLEQNLRLQLSHYEAYARSEQAIKIFKHDYKKLVLTVSSLLVNNQPQQALMMLEQMDHRLQENTMAHRAYSTNVLINAALVELANECQSNNIAFNAGIVLPQRIKNEEIEISALFDLLAKVAVECCKQVKDNRKIDMFSSVSEHWLTLSIEFSVPDAKAADMAKAHFDGSIELQASKGLVKKYDGFVENVFSDKLMKIFIHLNILSEGGEKNC